MLPNIVYEAGSYLFRVECVLYSLVLHFAFPVMPIYWLILAIGIYAFLFTVFKYRFDNQFLRLLVDIAFILFSLCGQPQGLAQYFFLLLPMVNAVAYGGNHKSIFPLLVVTVLAIYYKDNYEVLKAHYIAPLALGLINYYAQKIREFNETVKGVTESIDNFFVNKELYVKSHQIYRNLIKILNDHLGYDYVNNISTYVQKGDKFWLVNSSEFLWDRTYNLMEEQLVEIKRYKTLNISPNKLKTTDVLYSSEMDDSFYLFHVSFNEENGNLFSFFMGNRVMQIAMSKLAVLQNTIYLAHERQSKVLSDISDGYFYVISARNVMHYVRNVLSPIGNVLQFYSSTNLTAEQKKRMENLMKKELKRANNNYQGLVEKANFLLNTTANPFSPSRDVEIPVKDLYVIISNLAEDNLNISVNVDDATKKNVESKKKYIKANDIELQVMFTDWVANVGKYSKTLKEIEFSIDNMNAYVRFKNDYDEPIVNVDALIKNINSGQKGEVIVGKSFGISNIVQIANNWGIRLDAHKETISDDLGTRNILCFTFFIKLYDGNDSRAN